MTDKRKEIIKCLRTFFIMNADKYELELAFLFGSWATGIPRRESDVDIGVVFSEEPLSDDESFERLTDISFFLSGDLSMDVNTIQIHEDFRNPMLYYNAIITGVPVFIKEQNRYIRLKNEAVYQMEDFSIFGIKWQLKIAEKNLEALRHG